MSVHRFYRGNKASASGLDPEAVHYEKNIVFDELAEGTDAVSESNIRLLVFAASVGYSRNKRVPNHDENGEVRWSYIAQNQRLSVIVSALAYADTGDLR